MSRLLIILGFLAFAGLAYYAVAHYSKKIESDVEMRTAQTLYTNGVTDTVTIEADGREIVLAGVAETPIMKQEAQELAMSVKGVIGVDNQIQVLEPSQELYLPDPMTEAGVEIQDNEELVETDIADLSDATEEYIEDVTDTIEENIHEALTPVMDKPSHVAVEDDKSDNIPEFDAKQLEDVTTDKEPSKTKPDETVKTDKVAQTTPEKETTVNMASVADNIKKSDDRLTKTPGNDYERCEQDLLKIVASSPVAFKDTTVSNNETLDKIVQRVKACPSNANINIDVYTDSQGDARDNLIRSGKQAKAVSIYLTEKGVKQALRPLGHGELDPIATNETAEGRKLNNRVEFNVSSGS